MASSALDCRRSSRNRLVARILVGLLFAAVVAQCSVLPVLAGDVVSDQKADAELRRLQALWKAQREEIRSAAIEGDHFELNLSSAFGKQNVERFVETVVTALQVDADLAPLEAATRTLPLPANGRTWGEFKMFLDGKRRRCRETWKQPNGIEDVYDVSFNGEQEVQNITAAKQVNVFQGRSNWHFTGLDDLRLVPFSGLDRGWKVESTPTPDVLRVSHEKRSFLVYSESGLLRDRTFGSKRVLQFQPAQFPGGIVFPRASLIFRMTPAFTRIDLYRIRKAEFNIPIGEEMFQMPVPKRTTILDLRNGKEAARPFRAVEAAPDALTVANERQRKKASTTQTPTSGNDWRTIAIVANVLVIFVIIGMFFRRSHAPARDG